jgi:hypothetical protein
MEMVMNSTTATNVIMLPTKGHPVSRLYLPPLMMTTKVTKPPKQRMVANEAMNPTVLHREQK